MPSWRRARLHTLFCPTQPNPPKAFLTNPTHAVPRKTRGFVRSGSTGDSKPQASPSSTAQGPRQGNKLRARSSWLSSEPSACICRNHGSRFPRLFGEAIGRVPLQCDVAGNRARVRSRLTVTLHGTADAPIAGFRGHRSPSCLTVRPMHEVCVSPSKRRLFDDPARRQPNKGPKSPGSGLAGAHLRKQQHSADKSLLFGSFADMPLLQALPATQPFPPVVTHEMLCLSTCIYSLFASSGRRRKRSHTPSQKAQWSESCDKIQASARAVAASVPHLGRRPASGWWHSLLIA
jgi:hypothetical protein